MMHDVANQALDLALKYTDQAEIYVEKEEGVNVDIKKDKVDFAKEAFTFGVGIRVILDGKMGFSYSTNLDNLKILLKVRFLMLNPMKWMRILHLHLNQNILI